MELIAVNDPEAKLPYSKATIYKFHSLKRLPRVIFKVGGRLFFDMEEWKQIASECRDKHIAEAKRIRDQEA